MKKLACTLIFILLFCPIFAQDETLQFTIKGLVYVEKTNNYFQHYYNNKETVGLNNAYGCFSSSVVKEVKFNYVSD